MARVSYSRVAVTNLADTQPVSGTVAVSNFPATQPVSGTVTVAAQTQPTSRYGAVTALVTSAARTSTNQSAGVSNTTGAIGVIVYMRITAASGTGGVRFEMQAQDPIGGSVWDNWPGGISNTTATGNYVLVVYPAALTVGSTMVKSAQAMVLPNTWRLNVIHGDASSYTYAISYQLLY